METKNSYHSLDSENGDTLYGEDAHIRDYLEVLFRRRWIVLLALVSSLGAAGFHQVRPSRIYRAEAVVEIGPEFEKTASDYSNYFQTELIKLRSSAVLESVVKKLRLAQDERYALAKDILDAVKKDIEVSVVRSTRLVTIKVQHTSPETAAQIADALAGTFPAHKAQVIERARVPGSPVTSDTMAWLLAILSGLAGGIFLAFFLEYFDDTVKNQSHIETYLNLPYLGGIPHLQASDVAGTYLYSHFHRRSQATENFREIRSFLSLRGKGHAPQILTVTSALGSEGRTVFASNLAIVTAQTGLRTLLIEADLRRPSLQKAYQAPLKVGLTTYLMGEAKQLDEVTQKTPVVNLDLLACGPTVPDPSELIESERLKDLLNAARVAYDRIIVDCPPVSAVRDPLVVSAEADGTVLLIRSNKVRHKIARVFARRLREAGINVLGVALNDWSAVKLPHLGLSRKKATRLAE